MIFGNCRASKAKQAPRVLELANAMRSMKARIEWPQRIEDRAALKLAQDRKSVFAVAAHQTGLLGLEVQLGPHGASLLG